MRRALLAIIVALLALGVSTDRAWAEAEPLLESPTAKPTGYWALTLMGGAAFPIGGYADARELGLAASGSIAYIGKNGLGAALVGGYSPLPANNLDDGVRRENHLVHAALAPRFLLGRGALRVYVSGGGGMLYERATEEVTLGEEVGRTTTTTTAVAAVAEAGIELHVLGAGGLMLAGSYFRGFDDGKAQLAAAKAGFVLTF